MTLHTEQKNAEPHLAPDLGGFFGGTLRTIASLLGRDDSDDPLVADKDFRCDAPVSFSALPDGNICLPGTGLEETPERNIPLPVNPNEDSKWQNRRRDIFKGDLFTAKTRHAAEHALYLIAKSIEFERYQDTVNHPKRHIQPLNKLMYSYYRDTLKGIEITPDSASSVYNEDSGTLSLPAECLGDYFEIVDNLVYGLLKCTPGSGHDESGKSYARELSYRNSDCLERLIAIKNYLLALEAQPEHKLIWEKSIDRNIAYRSFCKERESLTQILFEMKDYISSSFQEMVHSGKEYTGNAERLRDLFNEVYEISTGLGSRAPITFMEGSFHVDADGQVLGMLSYDKGVGIEADDDDSSVSFDFSNLDDNSDVRILSVPDTLERCPLVYSKMEVAADLLNLSTREGGVFRLKSLEESVQKVQDAWDQYVKAANSYANLFPIGEVRLQVRL